MRIYIIAQVPRSLAPVVRRRPGRQEQRGHHQEAFVQHGSVLRGRQRELLLGVALARRQGHLDRLLEPADRSTQVRCACRSGISSADWS